jgi:methylated-DNA-[protein]-cysteine S-methyltransferase
MAGSNVSFVEAAELGEAPIWVERLGHPLRVELAVTADEHGELLVAVALGAGEALEAFAARSGLRLRPRAALSSAAAQLREYLDDARTEFDLRVCVRGSEFELAAWRALTEIPHGQTRTYGAQAAAIGRPSAARAIGRANGRNPVPIVVPCHRVIGSDGSLTGFAGGLALKRWLLEHERALAPLPVARPVLDPPAERPQLGLFG